MRNWTKRKRTFQQLLRIEFTKRVIQFAGKIENSKFKSLKGLTKFKLIKSLKPLVEQLHDDKFDRISCPQNLEVKFNNICFADLFFPEEFTCLQKGLNTLFSKHTSPSIRFKDDKNRLNQWFDNIKNSNSETFGIINGGWLIFDHKKDRSLKLIDSAQINLLHIRSSFIILTISITPSKEFRRKFDSIVRATPQRQKEILGFSLRYGVTNWSFTASFATREAELENIFLEINKTVVNLFRRTFDAGLSKFAPLPSIEVISINSPLKELSDNIILSRSSGDLRACWNFFRSLGYPSNSSKIYRSHNWWNIYEVHRSQVFYQSSQCYQILMSTIDYKKENNLVNENNDTAYFNLDYFEDILFILALDHFYDVLKNLIIDLKTDLEPILSNQVKGEIKLKTLKTGISKISVLNGLYFQQSRLWGGINEKWVWDYVFDKAKYLRRKTNNHGDSENLLNDIKYRITQKKKFCDKQLNLLKLSYEQLLSYKATETNLSLQQATFWLSIVVAFLTFTTLLPEDIRKNLWSLFLKFINTHLF